MPDDQSLRDGTAPVLRRREIERSEREPLHAYPVADPRYSKDPYELEGGGFDFWGTVRTLWRRKFMIAAIAILGTAAALLLTLRVTPLYKSVATIEVQRQETRIIESASIDPVSIADNEYMATQYALIKSRALAERVVEILDLANDPRYADSELGREARVRSAAAKITDNLRVSPEGRSRVVNISFVSDDPREAARIANAIVENFIDGSMERKFNTTSYARKFLNERLVTARETLQNAERSLVEYAQAEEILDLSTSGGNTSLDADALVTLNQELAKAQSERIIAEQRYRENLSSETTQEVLDNEDLARLRALKTELTAEYQEKLGTFKPGYPDMVKLQARIDAIDEEMDQVKATIVLASEASFKAAAAREQSLNERIRDLKGSVQDERGRKIQYTILQREVDTARTQYEALLQRLKEVSIAGGVGSSQISFVDRAVPAALPFEPNLFRNLLQALILSLAAGIGLAFGLNYIDDTIKTPEDLKQKIGLPAIGVIPKIKGRNVSITAELEDARSSITEAFYSARTALEFVTDSGAPKSLAITSTRPSEGKTSTSVALAMTFARSGSSALIIDADLRRPSFVANAKESVGLSGLLTQDHQLSDQIVASNTPNLFLLPSGIIPPNPAQLLTSVRLARIIEEAEENFDIVIVDCPPLLGFADAPLLGSVCDATLMVVESGSIRRPAAERTLERLLESDANVVGAVLVKFDAKKSGYENSDYYYAYGSGSYDYGAKRIKSSSSKRRKVDLFSARGRSDDDRTRLE